MTLDGILSVTAVERQTGLSKTLKIDNALSQMNKGTGQISQDRMDNFFEEHVVFNQHSVYDEEIEESDDSESPIKARLSVIQRVDQPHLSNSPHSPIVAKARALRATLSGDDANDVDRIVELIETAEKNNDKEILPGLQAELDDLLFYLA